MGWWSATIMGGDTPLDYLSEIGRLCGVEYEYSDKKREGAFCGYQFTRAKLKAAMPKLLEWARYPKRYEPSVAYTTLGAVMLWTGVRWTKALKDEFIGAANKDEWAMESRERAHFIRDFAEKVRTAVSGVTVELVSEGLIEQMNKAATR